MNETLYSWTFNFHKVVRQHNSGTVKILFYRIPQLIYESKSERIIEIGPYLPKLSTNFNSLLFLSHPVNIPAKFHTDPVWNDGALVFFEQVTPTRTTTNE